MGLEVKRENGIYSINQSKFIKKVISSYGFEESKIAKIPMDSAYERNQQNKQLMTSNAKYQSLIGSLLYISLNSRPDISSSVAILSQKISQPTEYDWNQLKQVVRYLKGTIDFKLYLSSLNQTSSDDHEIIGYADASWGESKDDGKSQSGYIFKLNGGTISWRSLKQSSTALSSTEAELIALSEAMKELIWIRDLLEEIKQPFKQPIVIFEDNESVRKIVKGTSKSNRTKHINVRYHFIRDYIKNGMVTCEYCPTEEMTADLLTKPLIRIKLEKFRNDMGLHI